MTLIEFLNDIHTKIVRPDINDDFFVTVERDLGDDTLSISFSGYQRDFFVYGKYKTIPDFIDAIPKSNCFIFSFTQALYESLKLFEDDADDPNVETHVKFVSNYVHDWQKRSPIKSDRDRRYFGISMESNNKDESRVSTRMFHNFMKGSPKHFAYRSNRGMSEKALGSFSINFSSDEVKEIVNHFNVSSLVCQKTFPDVKGFNNVIFFRRNSKGKIFLDARDGLFAYSVHTDLDIDELELYIPIRIRIRSFIFILNLCSDNNLGVVIKGSGFPSGIPAYLKMIYEDDFARFEYLLPYRQAGLNVLHY